MRPPGEASRVFGRLREFRVDPFELGFMLCALRDKSLLKAKKILSSEEEAAMTTCAPRELKSACKPALRPECRVRCRTRRTHRGQLAGDGKCLQQGGLPGPVLTNQDTDGGIQVELPKGRQGWNGERKPALHAGRVRHRGQLRWRRGRLAVRDLQWVLRGWSWRANSTYRASERNTATPPGVR